jgi:hypothetical protein
MATRKGEEMLKKWTEILPALAAPFPPEEIEWRVAQAGTTSVGRPWAKVLAYLTARAIDNRLDAVVGGENWWVQYRHEGNAVLCGITIRGTDDGTDRMVREITKWDGADQTDIEAVKGGLSGAKKRAAVPWGIGRYLYSLDEGWAVASLNKETGAEWHYQPANKNKGTPAFYWMPPKLPEWALPAGVKVKGTRKEAERPDPMNDPQPAARSTNPYGIPPAAWLRLDAVQSYDELLQVCGDLKDDSRGKNPEGENWNVGLNRFFKDRADFLKDLAQEVLGDNGGMR